MAFPVPANELERLATIDELGLLRSDGSQELDAIATLAADVLDCPISLITLLGKDEQWFKAKCGLEGEYSPRELAFCNHTILRNEPMIVSDARKDRRFKDNPLVTGEPHVVFYAGVPISIDGFHNLGTMCVVDTRPRELTDLQVRRLSNLGRAAEGLFAAYKSTRQAERALLAGEEKERALARVVNVMNQITGLSGVGGWELELDQNRLTWTDETKRIHEVPLDYEPRLEKAIEFYAPEARPLISSAVEQAIETGSSWDLELPLITAKGRDIWVRAVGSPTHKDGSVVGLIGAFQDISERMGNERRILESENAARTRSEELRTILDNMDEGVSVFDSESRLSIWNDKYVKIFDKLPGEVHKGAHFRNLLEQEQARGDFEGSVDDHIRKLIGRLDRQQSVSCQFRTTKGKIINSTHSPMPGGGWVGTHSDVTAQVIAAEQARAIINTVVDGIITIDDRGLIREFNPASERLFGYEAHEVLGQNIAMLMPAEQNDNHDRYLKNFDPTAKTKVVGKGRELIGLRKDGSTFALELSLSVTTDKGGRTFTGILRDVTERRQMDMMKNQFVSNVNHELRTPLTTIRCSLGLLIKESQNLLNDKSKRLLDLSYDGCSRLSHIIDDILDMEKIASGKMDYRFEVVEMSAQVRDVIHRHLSYAELNNVQFEMRPSAAPIYCRVDPNRFNQALVNLLSNAAKFSLPRTTITFAVDAKQVDTVRISVIDRGEGIPQHFVSKVFEKFAQADSSSTRHKGGSGLGLSISKEIIHAFGGKIDFETELGVGTTFWIELPIVEAPEQERRKAS